MAFPQAFEKPLNALTLKGTGWFQRSPNLLALPFKALSKPSGVFQDAFGTGSHQGTAATAESIAEETAFERYTSAELISNSRGFKESQGRG